MTDEHLAQSHTGAGCGNHDVVGTRSVVIDAEAHGPAAGSPRAAITDSKLSSRLNEATVRLSFSSK